MTARKLLCTTWILLFHPLFYGQASTQELPDAPTPAQSQNEEQIPIAAPVEQPPLGEVVRLEADHQSKEKNIIRLSGNVVVHYLDYVLHSQEVTYDDDTGEVVSAGRLELDGGPDHEHITAANGDMNLKRQTAHFFHAVGTITPPPRPVVVTPVNQLSRQVLSSTSPFLFTAKEVVKEGNGHYTMYSAVVTSCELPHPDWAFHTHRAQVDENMAKLYQSLFTLIDVPIFYFPYATHAVETEQRQSGLLIPVVGISSTKGLVLGEEYYWAINRSMDLQLGLEYFSLRGFAPLGQFRYKGQGLDFAQVRFTALKDRGEPGSATATTPEVDQGGTDILFNGRHDFDPETRIAANIEYLSSYVYRQAFAENFNQAVASQVKSDAYFVHEDHGYAGILSIDRFQNFLDTQGDQVRILHVPTLEGEALNHWGEYGLYWYGDVALDGLERSQPAFSTKGIVERLDVYPHLGYAWHGAGWTFRTEEALRDTFYGRSQSPLTSAAQLYADQQVEIDAALNRKDAEASVDVLAPAIERTWDSGNGWQWRHVVQPEAQYRFVGGIDNFPQVLRFDLIDAASDTNQIEYGLTQRLYAKHRGMRPCKANEKPAEGQKLCRGDVQEALRWFVGQEYYIDPTFGGAVVANYRNVLATALDFTGIDFVTAPRDLSPVVSRVKWSSAQRVDVEWDLDYDTKKGELLANNTFIDVHGSEWFAGSGVSKLVLPDESVLGNIPQDSQFLQVRWTLGYGSTARHGFSAATTGGYDVEANAVQYTVIQGTYNWNCCGFNTEYRRLALGTARNENEYRFSLTLAGVGTAGNLRRSERLY